MISRIPRLVAEKIGRAEIGPRTGKGFYDYTDLDIQVLFNEKHRGFVELLRVYKESKTLDFSGGISAKGSPETNPNTTEEKGGAVNV